MTTKIDFSKFDSLLKEMTATVTPTQEQVTLLKEVSRDVEKQVLIAAKEQLSDAADAIYYPNSALKCWYLLDVRGRNIGYLWLNADNTVQVTVNSQISDRVN